MNIYAAVYTFNRPKVMEASLRSILAQSKQPDRLDIIDNASEGETTAKIIELTTGLNNVSVTLKNQNRGATHSGRFALEIARKENPRYFFQLESDYIFKPWAFDVATDIMENTEQGKLALGVVGYDAPNCYQSLYQNHIFPDGMIRQVGEDNVNRSILYRPFWAKRYLVDFVSNTHPTCYLNWQRIQEVAAEFPELNRLLDEVYDPQPNPNYPTAAEYARKRYIDDGMLSHAINLCWNRWAIKHNIDRTKFAAWLNVKPSLAQNINGGGDHSQVNEMSTDNGSPTWVE